MATQRYTETVSPITIRLRILKDLHAVPHQTGREVSPITIRLRILKVAELGTSGKSPRVSPITIRLRILKATPRSTNITETASFTHHDPLEDTERLCWIGGRFSGGKSFTHHDPLEDTERRQR